MKDLVSKLKSALGHNLFLINIINKNLLNLKVNGTPDHQKVKSMLEDGKMSFFTYTPNELKPYSVVIEGVRRSH